jgi:hypothetical protein
MKKRTPTKRTPTKRTPTKRTPTKRTTTKRTTTKRTKKSNGFKGMLKDEIVGTIKDELIENAADTTRDSFYKMKHKLTGYVNGIHTQHETRNGYCPTHGHF